MCSSDLDEGVDLTILNDYRQISLIKQPLLSVNNNPRATGDIYVQSQTLSVSGSIGNIQLDDTVKQNSTGASGTVVDVIDNNIRITNVEGIFKTGEDSGLTFSPSGTTDTSATVNSVNSVTPEPLLKNSGEVLFVENRTRIQRGANQIEDIKIVLEF